MKPSRTLPLLAALALNVSCRSYYTLADYPAVPKADTHVHVHTDRPTFADEAARANFRLVNIVVDGDGTWDRIEEQFRFCLAQAQAHPGRYRVVTSFSVEDFSAPGWRERTLRWLDTCFAQGAVGVKVWKNIGMVLTDSAGGRNVMLDDPRFDEVFARIQGAGRLVVGHLGEPLNCWLPLDEMTTNNDRSYFREHPQYHMYLHPELPSYHDQMGARDRRLDRHAGLPFVGAHLASLEWNVDTLAAWLDRYPRATVDLAARMGQIFHQTRQDRDKVRRFFIAYQNRILYATDLGDRGDSSPERLIDNMRATWLRDWQYFTTDDTMTSDLVDGEFQGVQLPKGVVNKIYFRNAARVFGF